MYFKSGYTVKSPILPITPVLPQSWEKNSNLMREKKTAKN
jgi:hypothetical protein